MIKILIILSIFALTACQPSPGSGGSELSSDLHLDKWLFINYWAVWCTPCKTEIPEFNEFADKYKESVSVFAINYDGLEGEQLYDEATKLNINFFILEKDPSGSLGYPRPIVLPSTIIIDPRGNVRKTLIGPQTKDSLRAILEDEASH